MLHSNRNIRIHLREDTLHLVGSGKVILTNNLFIFLSFNTHTSSGGIYLDDNIRNTKPGISIWKSSTAELEMLQNDRLKFLRNPLIAFLIINSLRNKIIDLGEILKDLLPPNLVNIETKLVKAPQMPN